MKSGSESAAKQPQKDTNQPENHSGINLFDSIGHLWLRFERFGRDILGVAFLAIGLLTLMGLAKLTQGSIISPWVFFIRRWLGWGGYFLPVAFIAGGLYALKRASSETRFDLKRILSFEGFAFSLMALLAIAGGHSLERADAGLDGGVIGWALADIFQMALPTPLATLVLILLSAVFLYYGLGISKWLTAQFEAWLLAEDTGDTHLEVELPDTKEDQEDFQSADQGLEPNIPSKTRTALRKGTAAKITAGRRNDRLPPLTLLKQDQIVHPEEANIHANALIIEKTLLEFGIPSRVVGFRVGPTVTQYAVEPGFIEKTGLDGQLVKQKVRIAQISGLARDLALALSAERLRIEAPVPGHTFVGIEVPNDRSAVVGLRSAVESDAFMRLQSPLGVALGRDVSGQVVAADLGRMPHLLIAGTTGSGKSVCIQALTLCLAMNNTPDELRMAMLDPKMVELIRFNGLPHLLGKVETDPERMIGVLRWALVEMDNRYKLLEAFHVRDLEGYNRKAVRKHQPTLPRIVILIDELADLMMSSPDQTENSLVRLAQLARATGIHLIVATQRPSTDVLTGLIKANFPARISFTVASSVDSRVILDSNGAETLLGKGDMLFLNPEVGTPQRAQGIYVTDQEIEKIIQYWQSANPDREEDSPWEELLATEEAAPDNLLKQAIDIVRRSRHASASMLQRRLRVGYPRAARLIDELEELGVVGPSQGGGREREVLWSPDDVDLGQEGSMDEFDEDR